MIGEASSGKSSIIGRLLDETFSIPARTPFEHLDAPAQHELAFQPSGTTGVLLAERQGRERADADQFRLQIRSREFALLEKNLQDQFLHNTPPASLEADAAILVVDASQPAHHRARQFGALIDQLGIRHVIVAINKMDRINYDAGRFREIETSVTTELEALGLKPTEAIPVSTRDAVGITEHTYTSEWYRLTLVAALQQTEPAAGCIPNPVNREQNREFYASDQTKSESRPRGVR